MHASLVELVWRRAGFCCEYCRIPWRYDETGFEIDHIIPVQHGGQTRASNLALTCYTDNHKKGPNLAGIDPQSRKRMWLFHPRRNTWERHFRWNGPILVGRSPVGRATIAVLDSNRSIRVLQRAQLIAEGVFP